METSFPYNPDLYLESDPSSNSHPQNNSVDPKTERRALEIWAEMDNELTRLGLLSKPLIHDGVMSPEEAYARAEESRKRIESINTLVGDIPA